MTSRAETPSGSTAEMSVPIDVGPVTISMRGITKRYGSVTACDDITFEVGRGEVRGLLGQNGAGKSTLMKILAGVVAPDSGHIYVDGQRAPIAQPADAARLGIGIVHQHFSLVAPMRVWENVALNDRGRVSQKSVIEEIEQVSERFGLKVDPLATVSDLGAGERQRVELVKALRGQPRLLVLDEPTAVLTMAESTALFDVLRKIVKQVDGSVVLISHKLDEIIRATDHVSILRDGRLVETLPTRSADAPGLAKLMVGREVALRSEGLALGVVAERHEARRSAHAAPAPAESDEGVALRVTDAYVLADDGRVLLDGCSLEVRPGEILGLAGVEGNGQATLADVLSSLVSLDRGVVEVHGNKVKTGSAGAMLRAGIAIVPEDRHKSGCVLGMSIAENLAMSELSRFKRRGLLSRRRLDSWATELIERFGVVTPSSDLPMSSLSGGNQQRVVLARVLASTPRVLVAAQPSRGLDVGAIEYVASQLRQAADDGIAVLLISSELEEIFALADRIAVIHRGRVVGMAPTEEMTMERIGLMMGGQAA